MRERVLLLAAVALGACHSPPHGHDVPVPQPSDPGLVRVNGQEIPLDALIGAGLLPPPAEIEAYRPAVQSLVTEALAKGRAFELLTSLCTTAPHRLAGSSGAQAAVEWAQRTMTELGLENVRLQPCMVPTWVRGDVARLTVLAPRSLAGQQLPILALGGSVAS